ncbi:hypothetical protein LINPERPRIM_LOCUS22821, partial [Linum perenne]
EEEVEGRKRRRRGEEGGWGKVGGGGRTFEGGGEEGRRRGEERGWGKVGGGGRTFEGGGEEGGRSEVEGRRDDDRRWRGEGRTVGGGGRRRWRVGVAIRSFRSNRTEFGRSPSSNSAQTWNRDRDRFEFGLTVTEFKSVTVNRVNRCPTEFRRLHSPAERHRSTSPSLDQQRPAWKLPPTKLLRPDPPITLIPVVVTRPRLLIPLSQALFFFFDRSPSILPKLRAPPVGTELLTAAPSDSWSRRNRASLYEAEEGPA